MSNVRAVVRREYLQRVRSKWFVFATVAGPVFLLLAILIPALLASRNERTDRTLALVDRTGELAAALTPKLEEAGWTVEDAGDPGDDAYQALRGRIEEDELGAVLVVDAGTLTAGSAQLEARRQVSTVDRLVLRNALVNTVIARRLGAEDEDTRALLGGGSLDVAVLGGGAGADDMDFVVPYVGAFILYMTVLLYAVSVMRSVLEEKTSRIVEVVISSMKPSELMLGKILGVGAVGLTQLAIWAVSAALVFSVAIPRILALRPELARLSELGRVAPGLGFVLLFFVFFLGGYFIYAAIYAAVGAMCNSEEEAQQAQLPVTLLLVVPIVLVAGVIQEPGAPASVALSLVPFFSPVLMFARAAQGAAPVWQIGLSVVLMAATVWAVAWLAGRIYRVGILMAGKRPTLPELWRWVREA